MPGVHVSSAAPSACPWASDRGEDARGSWAELRLSDVAHRLRWIPPGSFLMGSPREEPERDGDELSHEVELTRGFWLGETACPQALWQQVMGANPSEHPDPVRPVENVSHDDAQGFLQRVRELRPGLALRLPTEAEWEYACRAGTTTPFWFGASIDTTQANFDGFSPYNGAEPGIYRQVVIEVKALPCNAWGLYQMHGNVREWCADWYGPYSEQPVVDPTGPASGDERVLRGGSWYSRARGCRSAARKARRPSWREDNYGFRIACDA